MRSLFSGHRNVVPQHVPPRIYRRVPFEAAVRLEFDRFHGFVEQYSANLSLGGMYIKSDEPPPLGSEVSVEFALEDGFELIRGRGRVAWVSPPGEGSDAPGFGLRFLELTPGSRELIFRLVERRVREGDRVFDLDDAAPATAAGRLIHDEERLATPPWERPAPRAGEEATAAAGHGGPAAAGGEVVRYGRAAREAAEAGAAGTGAAGTGAAGTDAAPAEVLDFSAFDPAGPTSQGEDDPNASFAGLVDDAADDDEEVSSGQAPATLSFAEPEPASRLPLDEEPQPSAADAGAGAVGFDSLGRARVEEWPPRGWGEEAAEGAAEGAVEVPEASGADRADPATTFGSAGEADIPGDAGAAGDASWPAGRPAPGAAGERGDFPAAAAGEGDAAPDAAKWAWLEAEAGEAGAGDSPSPAEPAGAARAGEVAGESDEPPQRTRRSARLAAIAAAIAVGIALLALAGFLFLRAGDGGAPLARAADDRSAGGATDGAAPPGAGADGDRALPAAAATPVAPAAGEAASASPDAAAAPPDTAAPPLDAATGARTIDRIAWQRRDGGVDVEIAGSGPIAPALVDHFRVGGERPRLVVRIAGVERPYARGDVAIGGALVERVRTGFHPAAAGDPGSLHVVFDLAAPGTAAAVETVDGRVRVRFEER